MRQIRNPVRMSLTTPPQEGSPREPGDLMRNSMLYREFLAEREEILRHKWIESEKAGQDIGFEKALLDWIINHRSAWRTGRQQSHAH